jgi:hypothetical protein
VSDHRKDTTEAQHDSKARLSDLRDPDALYVQPPQPATLRVKFTHSEDYRTVTIRGKTHTLTAQQAQMVEILHQAHSDGNPDVSVALILERLEKSHSRWQDTFKSNPKAKQELIESGVRKGTLRLKL